MNKAIYKSSFTNINVSEKVINEVISKIELLNDIKPQKRINYYKIIIPVLTILVVSIISVSAAPYLGVTDVFKGFFNQFFTSEISELNQSQQNFLENHGVIPNDKFTKDGVNLDIEGIIGDSDYVFLKYSVSAEEKHDEDTFNSFLSPEIYIGEMSKGIVPVGNTKNYEIDKVTDNKINYAAILDTKTGATVIGKNATFVMKSRNLYQSIGINLADTYKKHGVASIDNSDDIYSISNSNLNFPFDNEYGGKITLNSIGFIDGKLILAVNSSEYYKDPKLFLRNKKTSEIYSRCDGVAFASRGKIDLYPYEVISIDVLKDLEIVMPIEYHFSFPLSYVDSTKDIDISKQSPLILGATKINKIRISPLSLNIDGTSTNSSHPLFAYDACSIRLKDKTVLSNFKFGNCSYGNDNGNFNTGVPFESPIILNSIEAIIIKSGDNVIEIPMR